MVMAGSRREALADAAIRVTASAGLRGLTHRAVDAEAGLPPGSTSYYCRTREALLVMTMERLGEQSRADLDGQGAAGLPTDLDQLAELAGQLLHRWMTTDRDRHLARYELTMEATRRPELRATLHAEGARLRALVVASLVAAGSPDPERHGRDLTACLDGLLFDQIAGAGEQADDPTGLRSTVRELLRGMLGR